MICPQCGANVPDGARFCGSCGCRMDQVAQPSQPQYQAPTPAQNQYNGNAQFQAQPQPQPQQQQQAYRQPTPVPPQPQPQARQWQPATTPELGGLPRAVKDDRNIFVLVLLTIVTCGIYAYYNIYTMANDINTICSDDDESTGGLLVYILLSLVTCGFYGIYWEYKLANRIQANAPQFGLFVKESGTDIIMWRLLGALICGLGTFYGEHLLLENMNKIAHAYNAQHGFVYQPQS